MNETDPYSSRHETTQSPYHYTDPSQAGGIIDTVPGITRSADGLSSIDLLSDEDRLQVQTYRQLLEDLEQARKNLSPNALYHLRSRGLIK